MKSIFKKLSILSILSLGLISIASCKNSGHYLNPEDKEDFEIIEFGSFAQTYVNDKEIQEQLDEITKDDDETYLNTLNYINLDGEKYLKHQILPYKSIYNRAENHPFIKYEDYTDIDIEVGYFKVEPIKFIKRTYNEQTLYISEDVLYCKQYSANTTSKYDEDGRYFPNNYIKSDLRTFLNEDFYNLAFTEEEKSLINVTTLKNDLDSAAPGASKTYLPNKDCDDKIFVPSYDEINKMFKNDVSRIANTSDYARAIGCPVDTSEYFYGNGTFITRSPYQMKKDYVNFVNNSGILVNEDVYKFEHGKVQNDSCGIRIVLSINI